MQDKKYWYKVYNQHSRSKSYKNNIAKAKDVISEYLDLNVNSCINISGGKDSTCMMYLIYSLGSNVKCVTEKDAMDFPNELDYIESLRNLGFDIDIITPNINLEDVISNFDICEDIHSKDTKFSILYFYNLLKDYQSINNIKGVFLGLRAEESKGRAFNFKTKGHIYYNKAWQQMVCQPIAHLTAFDVFACLVSNDMPILDVYFKTEFVSSPNEIRKSWVLPSAQATSGQVQWLKHYYPDIFNRLSKSNPNIRTYT